MTAQQYLYFDRLADTRANGSLRITVRQGIQFHGILKGDLKPAIAEINQTLLTTMSACGDVVRNITASPLPIRNPQQARIEADAQLLSEHLKPKTRAYYQIFWTRRPPAKTRTSRFTGRPTCRANSRSASPMKPTTRLMS